MSTKISIAALTVIAAVFAAPEISNAKTHTHASGSYHHHRMVGSVYGSAYGFAPTYEPEHQSPNYDRQPYQMNNNLNPDFQLGGGER
jgi:hypothetical protein